MQSPVLLEKRIEHTRFCEYARQLIECVSQTKLQDFAMAEMTQVVTIKSEKIEIDHFRRICGEQPLWPKRISNSTRRNYCN